MAYRCFQGNICCWAMVVKTNTPLSPPLCPAPSCWSVSCRDRGRVPLSPAALGRRAPGPRGSASHASISETCSSAWRTSDSPAAPISSTRAFSNRLHVGEAEGGSGEWWEQLVPLQSRWDQTGKTNGNKEEAHFRTFEMYSTCGSHFGWPLYLFP